MKKKWIPLAILCGLVTGVANAKPEAKTKKSHWPNGARLVISFSMQFETGGQPEGAESPFAGNPLPKGQPDLPAESWFRYGAREGIYRMLRLWKKNDIHVTSHVVGAAAVKYPEVAKAIAAGGHEIAAHGIAWDDQWGLSYKDELKFVKDGIDVVEKITGKRGIGYNCNWLRRSPNTLKVLYHIDDVSRDEPFVTMVRGKRFVVMPYVLRNNDIVNIAGKNWSPDQFLAQLKAEFDQLYAEGADMRRMMSISLHDRIGGSPAVVHVVDQFIQYAKKHPGVVFMRKDNIAKMIKDDPDTPVDNAELKYNQKLPFKLIKDSETTGFLQPESAIMDAKNNVLYVSNINGKPTDKDGNGFISKVSPDGKILKLKWIEGLNAPKGLAIYGGKLYAADIDDLVEIDIATGKKKSYHAEGATFLNDVAADKDGNIYVSNTFGFSAIYRLSHGKLKTWMKTEQLEMPNGLTVVGDKLMVASWGKGLNPETFATKTLGHLLQVNIADQTITPLTMPAGNLDGIEPTLHGYLLTDWLSGKLRYYSTKRTTLEEVTTLPKGSADLCFVRKTKTVYIPLMLDGKLLKFHFGKN